MAQGLVDVFWNYQELIFTSFLSISISLEAEGEYFMKCILGVTLLKAIGPNGAFILLMKLIEIVF